MAIKGGLLAKPNYQYEKRQRDLAKKNKQEEKRRQKLSQKATETGEDSAGSSPGSDESVAASPDNATVPDK